MKETYNDAMTRVYADEGGYSNDAGDPGGPTMYGITIIDGRKYWKADATADDMKNMSKAVAAGIYQKHYADPLAYNQLPSGVDYAVLDYGINSGISRAAKVLQKIVGVPQDGIMGPATVTAANKADQVKTVNAIYAERLAFLKSLKTWSIFGRGWGSRCQRGNAFALQLITKYPNKSGSISGHVGGAGAVVVAGAAAVAAYPHLAGQIIFGTVIAAIVVWIAVDIYKGSK